MISSKGTKHKKDDKDKKLKLDKGVLSWEDFAIDKISSEDKLSNEDKSTTGKDTDTDSMVMKQYSYEKKARGFRFSEDSRDFLTKKSDVVKCEYKENLLIVDNLITNSTSIIIDEEYVI
jgi:hypothetical protein